jgi:hypothetical protein
MTAEEPLNIIHMGPKRDVVVCQQLSTVHIGHTQAVFGDDWRWNHDLSMRNQPEASLLSAITNIMTAEEPLNIIHMGPKRDVVVC